VSGQLPQRRRNYALALVMLARGRREAFLLFGGSSRDYLNSLAPLVAFSLVIGGLDVLAGKKAQGISLFLSSLCGLLAPPVIAEPLCRLWGCLDRWALFANMLNWVQILMAPVMAVVLITAVLLVSAGLPLVVSTLVLMLAVLTYVTWLQWFCARGALGLTRWRTVGLLFAIQLGTGLLMVLQMAGGGGGFMPPGLEKMLQ
jgi:hypothetical protein